MNDQLTITVSAAFIFDAFNAWWENEGTSYYSKSELAIAAQHWIEDYEISGIDPEDLARAYEADSE